MSWYVFCQFQDRLIDTIKLVQFTLVVIERIRVIQPILVILLVITQLYLPIELSQLIQAIELSQLILAIELSQLYLAINLSQLSTTMITGGILLITITTVLSRPEIGTGTTHYIHFLLKV